MSDIFLAYDIRGKYPENINENVAKRIGAALGTLVEQGRVCIGNDIRTSSPKLNKAVIAGLEATGTDVSSIGTATTAVCYFQTWTRKMDAGVFVTASHNPPVYNGFKFMEQ
ncbi:MAG: phosphomannomutase, partial [Candidatus Hodarchaeota archaeon]